MAMTAMSAPAARAEPVLSLRDVHKTFGGVVAIETFNLDIQAGEIVALVGDNGAGKSTLVKMIAGVYPPTSGVIRIGGADADLKDPSDSQARGIQVVYQDLALADSQPVYMNMFLGRELVTGPLRRLDRRRMISETEVLVKQLDIRIPSARATIRDLSGGQRQGVAIARATHWAAKLVLMDEPTAALGVAETAKVETIIAALKARNLAILIISHSLDQVFRLADRICVLRRGRQIGVREAAATDKNEIISMITGLSA
jgi:ABC-type sugar transport system ATPase subunit